MKAKKGGGKSYWTLETAWANPVIASHSATWTRLIQHTNLLSNVAAALIGIPATDETGIPATDTNGVPSSIRSWKLATAPQSSNIFVGLKVSLDTSLGGIRKLPGRRSIGGVHSSIVIDSSAWA